MSNRYQREIEDILSQVNDATPAYEEGGRRRQLTQKPLLSAPKKKYRWSLSNGRLMLMGVALLILSLPIGAIVPALAAPAALLGIALLIVAYIAFFSKPRSRAGKMWRGESIEDPPTAGGLQRFWGWLTRV